LQLLTDPIEQRIVIYSAAALVAQQINGIQWFYYFGTVFAKAIGLNDPFLITLIVFVIQVFVVLAAVLLANKLPRRPLLMITTGIMTVSIFVVGCLGIPGVSPATPLARSSSALLSSRLSPSTLHGVPSGGPLHRRWLWAATATRSTPSPSPPSGSQSESPSSLCPISTLLLDQPRPQDGPRLYRPVFHHLGVCVLFRGRGHREEHGRYQRVLSR